MNKKTKYLNKFLKYIGWSITGIIGFFIIGSLILHIPYVQKTISEKVLNELGKKTDAEIGIKGIAITLPGKIIIHELYAEDDNGDTLIRSNEIKVYFKIHKILKSEIYINDVSIGNSLINIKKYREDSAFNFDHFVNAFSNDRAEKKEPGNKFSINIRRINLQKIDFAFHDETKGSSYDVLLGQFKSRLNSIDFTSNNFQIDNIHIANSDVRLNIFPGNNESNESLNLNFSLDKQIRIQNTGFTLLNNGSKQLIKTGIDDLQLSSEKLDLPNETIELEKIDLTASLILFQQYELQENEKQDKKDGNNSQDNKSPPWNIALANLSLNTDSIQFINENAKPKPEGIDYNYLTIKNLILNANNANFDKSGIQTEIERFSFEERSGFKLNNLSTQAFLSDSSVIINNLLLTTPYSTIRNNTELYYSSQELLKEKPGESKFKIQFQNSVISSRDILFFQPELKQPGILSDTSHKMNIYSKIEGKIDSFEVDTLFTSINNSFINVHGRVNEITNTAGISLDLTIDTLQTTKNDVNFLMGDSLKSSLSDFPDTINIKGKFIGSTQAFNSELNIFSNFGNAELKAELLKNTGKEKRDYKITASADQLNIGALMSNDTLGLTTFVMNSEGTIAKDSFTNPEGKLKLHFKNLELSGYDYRDLKLNASYMNKTLDANSFIEDENLIFNLTATADFAKKNPEYMLFLDLKGAALQNLYLTKEDFDARTKVRMNLTGDTINNLNGNLLITDTEFVRRTESYRLDSLTAEITNKEKLLSANIRSEPIRFDYSGTSSLNEIIPLFKGIIDHYYNIETDSINYDPDGNFRFNLDIINTDILTEFFVPGINNFMPAKISGEVEGSANKIDLYAEFPQVSYNNNSLDSFRLSLNSNGNTLNFKIQHQGIASYPLIMEETNISGTIKNDSILFLTEIRGGSNEKKYHLKGTFENNNTDKILHINPDTLILNYKTFTVPVDNYISLNDSLLNINNFSISSGDQYIRAIKTNNSNIDSVSYMISFNDFSIDNFLGILESDKEILNGKINGDLFLASNAGRLLFDSELISSDISLYENRFFDEISLFANNIREGITQLEIDSKGKNNQLSLNGAIERAENMQNFDLDLNIDRLILSDFQPLFPTQVNELAGMIQGKIKIRGFSEDPEIQGTLSISDFNLIPSISNTPLKIGKEEILLNNNQLEFDDFKIKDVSEKVMNINGTITFINWNYPEFNLSVNSDQFKFLGSNENNFELLYGDLISALDLNLTGTSKNPDIEMEVKIAAETDLHLKVPEMNTATVEQEGIVKFVNSGDTLWQNIKEEKINPSDTLYDPAKGVSLSSNIEIEEGASFTVVIDAISEEQLYAKGKANLSLNLNKGNTNLAGRYEISEGNYSITLYNLIKRNFNIQKGSFLQWNGDVLGAQADLTASYEVRTSPLPLIIDETSQIQAENEFSNYENMPFLVKMNLSGVLLNPEIDFDLEVPRGSSNAIVETKLARLNNNESELNKQIFSLLLFNSFLNTSRIANSSFSSELNTTAQNGIGNLLTRKINSFTDQELENFDIELAIETYDKSAGSETDRQTNVSLDVSRQLFDERLKIRLGGNIAVENPENSSDYDFNTFAGDIIIEYKLDEDGNYRISGFNQTEYEDVIEGEVNKTGLSFIFQRSFYKMSELLKPKEKKEAKNNDQNE